MNAIVRLALLAAFQLVFAASVRAQQTAGADAVIGTWTLVSETLTRGGRRRSRSARIRWAP
jgi:hypothetical protein